MANEIETEMVFDPIFGGQAVKKIVKEAEVVGEKSGKAAGERFSKKFRAQAVDGFSRSLKRLGVLAIATGALIGAAFAGIVLGKAVKESIKAENALLGLKSVAAGTGQSVSQVTAAAKELAKDGLIPLVDVSNALKNLLASGLDADKSIQVFNALKNAASFNKQGQLELGQAIVGASIGIKNQNSILVDNAGITKNLSVLVKEHVRRVGGSVAALTEHQKQQAIANGIIREAALFQGDYNKLLTTFQGAQAQVTSQTRRFLVALGDIITKSPTVVTLIGEMAAGAGVLEKALGAFEGKDIFKTVTLAAIKLAMVVNFVVTPALEALLRVGNLVAIALSTSFLGVIRTFGNVALALAKIKDTFTGSKLADEILGFLAGTSEILVENAIDFKESLGSLFDPQTMQEQGQLYLEALNETVEKAKKSIDGLKIAGTKSGEDLAKALGISAKDINKLFDAALGRGISSTLEKLGTNLGEGKSLFDDFGKFIVGVIADMAINVGRATLATGIAMASFGDLTGTSAIMAGAGLIVIGGILKAFAGNAGTATAAPAGGGGVAAADASGGAPESVTQETQTIEPSTSVTVVVQGDILDSDESSLRIVELLNQAFDKQGAIIRNANFA